MPAKSEYVYVMRGDGRSKVGIAANTEHRFVELRSDGALEIVKTWHRPDDARQVEYNARRLLFEHCAKGMEWFAVPVEQLVAAVEQAIELVEAGDALLGPSDQRKARDAAHDEHWRKHREDMARLETELNEWIAADPANAAEFEVTVKKMTEK